MRKFKKSMALVIALAMVLTTFGFTAVSAANFPDTQGHWAESEIDKWSNAGVINGYSDGQFMPDANITRAELAKIISTERQYETSADISFSDVSGDEWFVDCLKMCVAQGIIGGYEDGTFRPDNAVTREEAATMFQRAYKINSIGLLSFTDSSSISDWATTSVTALVGAGVINGYEDGSFQPAAPITRAEVVKILDGITTAETDPMTTSSVSGGTNTTGGIGHLGNVGGSASSGGGASGGGSQSNSVRITFNANGGSFGGSSTTSLSISRNTLVGTKAPTPVREGYVFDGWYTTQSSAESLDSSRSWDPSSSPVSSSMTVYAGWYIEGSSAVTFETNNGTPKIARQDVKNGEYATEPTETLTRSGYTFTGWYESNKSSKTFDFENTPIKKNTIIYAGWQVNADMAASEITLPTAPVGSYQNGTLDAVPARVLPGESVTLYVTPPSGYGIEGMPELTYTSTDGTEKQITGLNEDGDNVYSFVMPGDVVNGTLQFKPHYITIDPPTPSPTATPAPTPTWDPSVPTPTPPRVPTYMFSVEPFSSMENMPANTEIGGLTVSKASDVDNSNKTFRVTGDNPNNSGQSYTRRLKIGTAELSFKVDGSCNLTIDAASASGADRSYSVYAGSQNLGSFMCYEDASDSFNVSYSGPATTIRIVPDAGINVYGIFVEYSGDIPTSDPSVTTGPVVTEAPTPSPTIDPNTRYPITLSESIVNGSITVQSGTTSSDDIRNVSLSVEDLEKNVDADGNVIKAGEPIPLNGTDNSDGTLVGFLDMQVCTETLNGEQVKLVRDPDGANPAGDPPYNVDGMGEPSGNVFKVTAGASGYLTIQVYVFGNKPFAIYDNTNREYITELPNSTSAYIYTETFQCEEGGSYYFWSRGSKVGLMNVTYSSGSLVARAGQEVTVVTRPDVGYKTSSVFTDPSTNVTQTAENTYRFLMPATGVEVGALFVDASAQEYTATAPQPENGSVELRKIAASTASETAELADDRTILDCSDNFLMANQSGGKWIMSSDVKDSRVENPVTEDNTNIKGNSTAKIKLSDKAVQYVLSEPINEGSFEFSYDFYDDNTASAGRSFRTYFDNAAHPYDESTGMATDFGNANAFFHMMDVRNNVYVTDAEADVGATSAAGTQVGSASLENGNWYRVVISGEFGTSDPYTVSYYLHGTDGTYNPDNISAEPVITTNEAPVVANRSHALAQIKFMRTASGNLYYDNIKLTAETGTPETDVYSIGAYPGESIQVVTTPDSGYETNSITVTAADGTPVTVDGDVFTMPASDVTVEVVFGDQAPATPPPTEKPVVTADPAGEVTSWITDYASLQTYGTTSVNGDINEVSIATNANYNGLTIYGQARALVADDSGKEVGGTEYSGRLKMGGSGSINGDSSSRAISFTPDAYGTVTVVFAHASGSSSADRSCVVEQNGAAQSYAVAGGASDTFTAAVYGGAPVYIYGEGGGINIYEVRYTKSTLENPPTLPPAPAEPTEQPSEPTEQPTEPTEQPTEPTEQPTEPTEQPSEPDPEETPSSDGNVWTASDYEQLYKQVGDPEPVTVNGMTVDPLNNDTGSSETWNLGDNKDTGITGLTGGGNPRPASLSGAPGADKIPTNGTVLKITVDRPGTVSGAFSLGGNKTAYVLKFPAGAANGEIIATQNNPDGNPTVAFEYSFAAEEGYEYYLYVAASKAVFGPITVTTE